MHPPRPALDCGRSLYHIFLFLALFCLFSTFLSGIFFLTTRKGASLERDIARRRSLSNASRSGDKIKFYIDEDECDPCGDATTKPTMKINREKWRIADMV